MTARRRNYPLPGRGGPPSPRIVWLAVMAIAAMSVLGLASAAAAERAEPAVHRPFELRAGLLMVKRGSLERSAERWMEGAGLGDDLDFRPFSFQRFPTSATGDAGSAGISLSYRFTPRHTVVVAWEHEELTRSLGHRAAPSPSYLDTSRDLFLETVADVTTVSARICLGGAQLRAEWGPALHLVEMRDMPGTGAGGTTRKTKFGFVMGAGASIPPDSRVFLDLGVQYRVLGTARRGGFLASFPGDSSSTLTLPKRSIPLSHAVITMGLGVRW